MVFSGIPWIHVSQSVTPWTISPLSLQLYKWLCVPSFLQSPLGIARQPPWSSQPTRMMTKERSHRHTPHSPEPCNWKAWLEKYQLAWISLINVCQESAEQHMTFLVFFCLIYREETECLGFRWGGICAHTWSRAAPRNPEGCCFQEIELSSLETMCRLSTTVLGYKGGKQRSWAPSMNFINFLPQKGYLVDKNFTKKLESSLKTYITIDTDTECLSTYCFDRFNSFLSSKVIVTLSLSWNLPEKKRSFTILLTGTKEPIN